MKCKKLFALLLSLCMLASSFVAVPVYADDLLEISVGSVVAEPGATITVPVSVANNANSGDPDYPGITAMTLNFKYDADVLTLDRKNSKQGEALSTLDMTKPGGSDQGDVNFVWDSTDADNSEGAILNMVFTVSADAVPGEYAIELDVVDCCDFNMDDIEYSTIDGVVTIPGAEEPEEPGDEEPEEPIGDGLTILVGKVTAEPGATVTVPVSIANNANSGSPDYPGITAMTLNFKYDADVLTLDRKASTQGEALSTLDMTKPGGTSQGDVNFVWDSTDADNSEGVILNMVFTVSENARPGETYAIEVSVVDCCDFDMADIETDTRNGKVKIPGGETPDEPEEPVYETTTIIVSDATGKPGDTITVPVSVAANKFGDPDYPGITAMTLNFKYNADALTLDRKSSTQGDALSTLDMTKPGGTNQGDVNFVWDGTDADNTEGVILNMVFTINEGISGGDYPIEVTIVDCCDYNMDDIAAEVVNGNVYVDAPIVCTHDYKGVITTPATHTTEGVMTYTCTKCNDSYTEVIPADVDNHDYATVEKLDADNHKLVCECGDFITEAHAWDKGVVTNAPTHFTTGTMTYTCTKCEETKTEDIPVTDIHEYGVWEKNDADTHKKVCPCGNEVTEAHDWNEGVETLAPTHTEEGVKTYTCTVCGETKTSVIPTVPGHSYGEEITTPATHTTEGLKTFTCACGDKYTEVIPKTPDHEYDEGAITTPATHTTEGVMTFTCICGDSYTKPIPKTPDHEYDEGVVTLEPTHLVEGIKTFTCICGDSYTEAIPKDPKHTYTSEVTKDATHYATGTMTYTCACGDTYTEDIPVIPHAYGEWVKVDANNHKKSCDCGHYVTAAHVWDEGVVTVEPTIEAEGIMTYTCDDCGATKTEAIEKLPDPNTDPTIKIVNVSAQQGEEVVVPVTISNLKDGEVGLTGLTLQIEYDDSVLTLVKADRGDGLPSLTFTKPGNMAANPLKFLWDGTDADYKNGTILNLTFKVAENAGDNGHFVTPIVIGACDANVQDIVIAAVPGEVTIHTHTVTLVKEVPATCTVDGTKTHYLCSECGGTFEDEAATIELDIVIPALGHEYGEWVKENDDTHIKTCIRGDDVLREAHTFGKVEVTQAPTCTETGIETHTCSVCNGTKEVVLPATGHVLTKVDYKAPTCTEVGNEEYYYCSVCKKAFETDDVYATAEFNYVIDALGHNLSDWTQIDGNVDVHTKTCSRCSYTETAPHIWDAGVVEFDATCTTNGNMIYTCTVCGGTKNVVIPAFGHDMTFNIEIPATCTVDGRVAHYNCANCGVNFADAEGNTVLNNLVIAAPGHNSDAGTVTQAPTCTEKGVKTFKCTVCGEVLKTEEVAALGHSMTYHAEEPAKCEVPGVEEYYYCATCGKYFDDPAGATELTSLVIPALVHNWNEGKVTQAPTCTQTGIMTYTCLRECGKTYTSIIDAIGHSMTYNAEVPATCTQTGTVENYYCANCKKYFADSFGYQEIADIVIPVTEHPYDNGVILPGDEATCTEAGVKTFTCTACGHTRTEVVPATGHKTKAVAKVDATCTQTGTIAHYACTNGCGMAFADKAATIPYTAEELVIPMKEHPYNAGVVTQAPTCTDTGVMLYTCTVCGHTKTEVIPETGHNTTFYPAIAATCETAGRKAHYACANCKLNFSDAECTIPAGDVVVAAKGHAHTSKVTTEPTCTDDGIKTFTCPNCGDVYYEVVPAHGHSTKLVAEVPATCTADGTIEHYLCTRCNKTFADAEATVALTAAQLVIGALGHNLSDWTQLNGDVDVHTKTCSRCSYTETEAHAWNEGVITTEPTCTVDGVRTFTCTVCNGTKTEVEPALDHDLSAWTQLGGNVDNHTKTCSRCDYTETEAHAWDAGKVTTKPTYTKEGIYTYTCTVCNGTKIEYLPVKDPDATGIEVTVGNMTARTGKTVQVPVKIENNKGITNFEFSFTFDNTVFTYTGAEQGKALKGLALTKAPEAVVNPEDADLSTVTFVWEGSENDNTNGDILYINFTVSEDLVIADDAGIVFDTAADVINAARQDGTEVGANIADGTITIIPFVKGDVNDDGLVNVSDVVLMRRNIVGGYGDKIVEDAADIDEDGDIDTRDVVLLRQYLLGGYGAEIWFD